MKYPVTRGKNIFTKSKKILFMHFRKGNNLLIRNNCILTVDQLKNKMQFNIASPAKKV